jgi:hypothetical protein
MFTTIVQGLIPSLAQVCPMSESRTCVRHLYANFRNEGHRGVLLKDLLWQAASSYTQVEFYNVMDEIKRLVWMHILGFQRSTHALGVGDGSIRMQNRTSYTTTPVKASTLG